MKIGKCLGCGKPIREGQKSHVCKWFWDNELKCFRRPVYRFVWNLDSGWKFPVAGFEPTEYPSIIQFGNHFKYVKNSLVNFVTKLS